MTSWSLEPLPNTIYMYTYTMWEVFEVVYVRYTEWPTSHTVRLTLIEGVSATTAGYVHDGGGEDSELTIHSDGYRWPIFQCECSRTGLT